MHGRAALVAVALIGLMFVLPGIAGITLGGTSAQAGWWLVVVGIIIGVAAMLALRPRRPA